MLEEVLENLKKIESRKDSPLEIKKIISNLESKKNKMDSFKNATNININ